jgi:heme exporter protein D
MYFDSLQALLLMDGHGPYVWAAYGITCVVLLSMLLLPRRRARQKMQQLTGELKRQQSAPNAKEDS